MILYKTIRKGVFNGYVTLESGHTVEQAVIKTIIGETNDSYITEIKESSTPYWDEMGKYEARYCMPLGIHKSRLINWAYMQLELFN